MIRALIRRCLTRNPESAPRWVALTPAEGVTSDGRGGLIHVTHSFGGPPLMTHIPAEHVNEWIEGDRND